MRASFLFTALLTGAALAFAAPARAQVTINIGPPAPPPPVIVVRKAHPPKHWKHRHHYQPQPVLLVPAQPVYYAQPGYYYGPGRGRGHGHGHGRH